MTATLEAAPKQGYKKPSNLKKFRVLVGIHTEPDWNAAPNDKGDLPKITVRATAHPDGGWAPSKVFSSPANLDTLHNTNISTKFQRVYEDAESARAAMALPDTAEVWDSALETVEEFAARMQAKRRTATPDQPIPLSTSQPQASQGNGGNRLGEGPQVQVPGVKQQGTSKQGR